MPLAPDPHRRPATRRQRHEAAPAGPRRDEPISFATVYADNVDAIYGFLARRTGAQAAEEITAQTFAEAFAHRDQFDPERGNTSAWLFGIAVNLLRRHFRSEERTLRAVTTLAGRTARSAEVDEDAIADRVLAKELWEEVAVALGQMSHGERDVLLLYAWADLPYASIAGVLDIPVGTVRSRLSRARARLSAVIDPEGTQQ